MYWLFNTQKISSPSVPAYLCGQPLDFEFTLVTETGDNIQNAYLAVVNKGEAGILQAKRHADSVYMSIDALGTPTCWLGTIPDGTETEIDFRISLPLGFPDGLYMPMVVVAYGEAIERDDPYFTETVTHDFTNEILDYFGA